MATAVFVQDGDAIDYTPVGDVSAGDVVVQGGLVAISKRDIAANTLGALVVEGVFDVAKATDVSFAAGDNVYWNATAEQAATSDGGGANKLMGPCVKAAALADTTVRTKLAPGGSNASSSSSSSSSGA